MDCITTLKFGAQVGDNQKILIKFGTKSHFQTDEDKVHRSRFSEDFESFASRPNLSAFSAAI